MENSKQKKRKEKSRAQQAPAGGCCGPKTRRGSASARSSASTHIRICVHGQMYLSRLASRCTVRVTLHAAAFYRRAVGRIAPCMSIHTRETQKAFAFEAEIQNGDAGNTWISSDSLKTGRLKKTGQLRHNMRQQMLSFSNSLACNVHKTTGKKAHSKRMQIRSPVRVPDVTTNTTRLS